jgi:hypothetical protein
VDDLEAIRQLKARYFRLMDTKAEGVWALHDIVIFPTGVRLDGYGHYHETYAKGVDAQWRIASSTLTRLHMDFATP